MGKLSPLAVDQSEASSRSRDLSRPISIGHVDTGMGLERMTAVVGDLWTSGPTPAPDLFR